MELDKQLIFESFVEEANERDSGWYAGSYFLFAPPTPSFSKKIRSDLKDEAGNLTRAMSFFELAEDHLKEYFKYAAAQGIANEIEIIIQEKRLVDILPRWNQKIIDDYEASMPKKFRGGNYKRWYDPEEKQIEEEPDAESPAAMIAAKVNSLPAVEEAIPTGEMEDLNIRTLVGLFSLYCTEPDNLLWDNSLFYIEKKEEGNYETKLVQYYFPDEDAASAGDESYPEEMPFRITGRMISIYNALQQKTKMQQADFTWDSVAITIGRDGVEDIQFILEEEELFFRW